MDVVGPSEGQLSQFLTIQELSATGRLSIATIHRLKRQGKIPYFQPADKHGRWLFPADAIERASQAASSPVANHESATAEPPMHLSGPCPAWMKANTPSSEHSDHAP
jgi:hypothetical protein